MIIQRAILSNLHIAPRKVRLVADRLRGLPVSTAEAELMFSRERSASFLLKLVRSAVATATHNQSVAANRLYIKSISVDGGRVLKRFMPRARGSASPILKRTSTVTLLLSESDKIKPIFTIIPPRREPKKHADEKGATTKIKSKPAVKRDIPDAVKEVPDSERSGVFRKFFRRKSI